MGQNHYTEGGRPHHFGGSTRTRVQAQLTRIVELRGVHEATRAGQRIAVSGRQTPWAATIDLTVTAICSDLAARVAEEDSTWVV